MPLKMAHLLEEHAQVTRNAREFYDGTHDDGPSAEESEVVAIRGGIRTQEIHIRRRQSRESEGGEIVFSTRFRACFL